MRGALNERHAFSSRKKIGLISEESQIEGVTSFRVIWLRIHQWMSGQIEQML
jgi:hypothetical protein